jgi:hypothetical protein
MPAGWLDSRIAGPVVVVVGPLVVGAVLVVMSPVVVGARLVVLGSEVVDTTVLVGTVVVGTVVVGGALVVGSAVVGGEVVVDPTMVGAAVTVGGVVVAPTVEGVAVVVVSPTAASAWAVAGRVVVAGPRVAFGCGPGVVDGGGWLVGSRGAVVVEVGAGVVGTAGSAPPGLRRGGLGWGSSVAEATRAARTAVASPKTKTSSLQGRRGVARCRGGGVGMVHRPGSAGSSGSCVCPCKPSPYRAHRVRLRTADRMVHSCRLVDVPPCIMLVSEGLGVAARLMPLLVGESGRDGITSHQPGRCWALCAQAPLGRGGNGCRLACPGCGAGPGGGRQGHVFPPPLVLRGPVGPVPATRARSSQPTSRPETPTSNGFADRSQQCPRSAVAVWICWLAGRLRL